MAVIKMNFLSKSLGRQTDVNLIIPTFSLKHTFEKLPNIYQKKEKFKVLILLHGFSGDHEDYIKFTNIVRYAEDNNLAVIMPSGFNSGYIDDKEGAKVHTYIAKELLEVCSFLYPISTKRNDVYLGGLSMGARGAMRIALSHPEIFSKVLCMSGAFSDLGYSSTEINWFGTSNDCFKGKIPGQTADLKETQEDAFYQAKMNVELNKELPEFFITVGTKDFSLKVCREASEKLIELGYKVKYEEVENYAHTWDFWELKVHEAIESFFTN